MAIFRSGQSGLLLPGTPRPTAFADIVVQDGLVRYWPLDVDTLKSSTVQTDLTGTSDGTLGAAPPTLAEGQIGKCYSFPGGATSYIDTSVNTGLNGNSLFSISLWAKAPSTQSSGELLTNSVDSGTFAGISFLWGSGGAADKTSFVIVDSVTSVIKVVANIAKLFNIWYHLVCVYTGTSTPNGMTVYENGEQIAQTRTGTTVNGSLVTDLPWRIGNDRNPADSGFIGFIDDVRVYNRVLTPSEIRAIYVAGLQGSRDQAALGIEFSGWLDDVIMRKPPVGAGPFMVFQKQTLAIPLQTTVNATLSVHS